MMRIIFPGVEGLSAAVGRGRLWRHQRAPSSPRQSLEARHRSFQQVSTVRHSTLIPLFC